MKTITSKRAIEKSMRIFPVENLAATIGRSRTSIESLGQFLQLGPKADASGFVQARILLYLLLLATCRQHHKGWNEQRAPWMTVKSWSFMSSA